MIKLEVLLSDKEMLAKFFIYILLCIAIGWHQHKYYTKKQSNYKLYVLLMTVITLIIGVIHIGIFTPKEGNNLLGYLLVITLVCYCLLRLSYNYIIHNDYKKVESAITLAFTGVVLVASILLVMSNHQTGFGVLNSSSKPLVTTNQPVNNSTPQVDNDAITPPQDGELQVTNENCIKELGVFLRDCYPTEDEYKEYNYKNDTLVNKYNTDKKKLSMQKTTLNDIDLKLTFLTNFKKILSEKEPDNQLNQIIDELVIQLEKDNVGYAQSVKELESTVKILETQINEDSKKIPEVKDKIEKVSDMKNSTTVFDYVNSIIPLEEDLLTEEVKTWVYKYIEEVDKK